MPSPYKKVQFIAYRAVTLFPTDPAKARLTSQAVPAPAPNMISWDNSPIRGSCTESWLIDDALVRAQRLRDVARASKSRLDSLGKLDKASDTLKIFMAPEFYFKQGNNGYPHAGTSGTPGDNPCSVDSLITALCSTFAVDEFKDWLIVPGTIFSYEGSTGKKSVYYQIKKPRTFLPGNTAATTADALPMKAGKMKPAGNSNRLNPDDIDWTQCYVSDVKVAPATPPAGYWLFERDFCTNYFNTSVVIKGGAPSSGSQGKYVLGWKGPMSWIDVAWFGPQMIKAWRNKGVLPRDLGPLDPRNRDAHKDAVYGALLRDWQTQKERVFTLDGITFGLEICLDHASGILKDMLARWDTSEAQWMSTSLGWIRNDVAIDVEALAGIDPGRLGINKAKLVRAPSNPPTDTELANVRAQTIELGKVSTVKSELSTRLSTASPTDKPKLERALRRLTDLEKSEARKHESKPTIDVQLIPACGMSICDGKDGDASQVVARDKGLVLLCDGSAPATDLRKMNGTDASKAVARIALDEELTDALQIPPPGDVASSDWEKQRLVAYESVSLS